MGGIAAWLETGLHSRHGLIRKGSAFALRVPKRWALMTTDADDRRHAPAVMANSFPKSGTHLLDQIAAGFPERINYGTFLASLTSSFQMRPRSESETLTIIGRIAPREIVRAHLFFHEKYAAALTAQNVVHYFIYRDLRDVVVSSCHYLRTINPWHRWRKHFAKCSTFEDALLLSIRGLYDTTGRALVPNVAERFAPFEPWLGRADVCDLRFEDLRSDGLSAALARMLDFYEARCTAPVDREATLQRIHAAINPEKSHTFRKGAGGGWREAFTDRCKEEFKHVAGDLLVRLGYESGQDW
ncbi:MAG TPA: sulfotransferase domain-containing protein [Lacipirellulaceae bacterium]|nr:sulfotransferase domain-containing protein [Lacipirellulaceae bacterium]